MLFGLITSSSSRAANTLRSRESAIRPELDSIFETIGCGRAALIPTPCWLSFFEVRYPLSTAPSCFGVFIVKSFIPVYLLPQIYRFRYKCKLYLFRYILHYIVFDINVKHIKFHLNAHPTVARQTGLRRNTPSKIRLETSGVHRQAGKAAHEKIDRCPALKCKASLCVHEWDELSYQVRLLKKRAGFHGASFGVSAVTGTVIRYSGSSRPPLNSTRLPLPSDTIGGSVRMRPNTLWRKRLGISFKEPAR